MGWPDSYTKKAHKQGYAARSVYKLAEMDAKHGILFAGARVLDLGCFPGSFSQYAAQRVGHDGLVVGIDVKKVPKRLADPVKTFVADVMGEAAERIIERHAPFDVVFSDMAPQTTGVRAMDQSRSALLVERAWELALQFGKPGGMAVIKFFQGADAQRFVDGLKKQGVVVKMAKPQASRSESYEMFLIARIP